MTSRSLDLIEAVVELKDRFPDMTDQEVLDWADEYQGHVPGYTNPESIGAEITLMAYDSGSVKATGRFCRVSFGFDPTKED